MEEKTVKFICFCRFKGCFR